MNKKEAEKFVTETFQNPYDDGRYLRFIKELLNGERLQYGSLDYKHPPSSYKGYIEEYRIFGVQQSSDSKRILFVSVKLNKSKSLDRARVMQRNFAADILRGKISNANGANAALIAFYGDEKEDWRLSFVTLDTELVCDEKGVCISEIVSPAKRFSYLVGVHEPCHTCMKRFCPLIEDEKNLLTVDQLLDVFHVETVTKEFFEEYKDCYLYLTESLQEIVDRDIAVKTEFENKNLVVADFSKKLLGQIVFLYFLQKKGWLGVKRDENWGSGPKDFMQQLFQKKIVPYDNFFDDILEPLFYEALARKNDSDYYSRFNVRIPFLNGGLFEAEYDWVHTNIVIENSVFEKIFETFDRYNFTVKEDEPLEREVAVDPEMLGKVFENLLEIKDRKSKGAFYTPRYIVHYMCQQSLIEYLSRHTEIPLEDIELFIRKGDELYAKTLHNMIEAKFDKNFVGEGGLPDSIASHALELDTLLHDIKIADPAVGSGAFPVGMMNEIVKARTALTPCLDIAGNNRNAYTLKRQTIENSIYGVDLDPSAVDISKLRFWLSLIVDEENPKEIKPLPNLDHKIVAGNSLLESFQGIKLFDPEILSSALDSAAEQIVEIEREIELLQEEQDSIPWGTEQERYQRISAEIQNLKKRKESILRDDPQKQILQTLSPVKTAQFKKSRKGLKRYRILQNQYFNEQDRFKKAELREEMDNLEWDIIEREAENSGNSSAVEELKTLKGKKGKPFFLWELYFSEVFTRENPGFDCVIGNPPYVQLQKMDDSIKESYANENYSSFIKTGDIYCLFYELGNRLLRTNGTLCFITSNKWMRAGYGEKLRNFFIQNTNPLLLIDFSGQSVFDEATVDVNILLFEKSQNKFKTSACLIKEDCRNNLSEYIQQKHTVSRFDTSESWVLLSEIMAKIKQKVESVGVPLKDWDISINRGILTGYNDAFIIDEETKNALVAADSKSADIIRPILRGRDIKKYGFENQNRWLIFIPWHFPLHNNPEIVGASELAEKAFKEQYPAVYSHLEKYKDHLKKRNKAETGIRYEWYVLQRWGAKYWEDFSKQKIMYPNMTKYLPFYLDTCAYMQNDKSFMITGKHLSYLTAFLNSSLFKYCFSDNFPELQGGTRELRKIFFDKIPVKQVSDKTDAMFAKYILEVQERKKNNLDTKSLEIEIDQLIFEIYELTLEERSEIGFIDII